MDEVAGIVIAVGSLFAGLFVLGWACGDFRRPAPQPPPPSAPAAPPAP
ncbi:MAG: hypothetical protein HYZ94_00320 [Candidatus Omnitrophica bacterium]|nr:hypothetical protein [Candidatus Omnitrophota bacterium]